MNYFVILSYFYGYVLATNESVFNEKKMKNKADLNLNEFSNLTDFLLLFVSESRRGKIIPLYRGSNLNDLFARLGIEYEPIKPNYELLLQRFFMIGEKGRHFYSTEYFNLGNNFMFGIEDHDEIILKKIFDVLNSFCKNKKKKDDRFFNGNEIFCEYFINKKGNKRKFVEFIANLDSRNQLVIRNYYLSRLHQFGSKVYKDKSILVSTSKLYSVAKGFTSQSQEEKKVIIHSWTPRISAFRNEFYNVLPVFTGGPYRHQREISIFAGILPHYIIGLEIIDDNKFFINPSILENTITKDVFSNGLPINQENFHQILKLTNYEGYFLTNENKTFEA